MASRGLGGSRTLRKLETGKNETLGVAVIDASLDGHSGTGRYALVDEDASVCVIDPALSIVPGCREACGQRWRSISIVRGGILWVSGVLCNCTGVVEHIELEREISPTADQTTTTLTLLGPPHVVEASPEQGIVQPSVAGAPVAAIWEPHPGQSEDG